MEVCSHADKQSLPQAAALCAGSYVAAAFTVYRVLTSELEQHCLANVHIQERARATAKVSSSVSRGVLRHLARSRQAAELAASLRI
jgi:hypothetical protein